LNFRKYIMTTNIIRNRADVSAASTADLIATYNALTGNAVERFSSRAIAERRVDMALMAAEDAAGHLGVPKGSDAVAMTKEELEAAQEPAAEAPKPVQAPSKSDEGTVGPDNGENPFKPGTLAYNLWVATKSAEANNPVRTKKPPKVKTEPSKPRNKELVVKATFAGLSKIQAGSKRAAVLKLVQEAQDATMTLATLEAEMGEPSRGYVQKLVEMKHLEVL
jgi:hypothetical protein